MNGPKAMASLTAGLLARKGQARPATRQQIGSFPDEPGWNDMEPRASSPVRRLPTAAPAIRASEQVRAVAEQRESLEKAFAPKIDMTADGEPAKSPAPVKPRAAPGSKGKSAFTLRLDEERHLKLRLLSAHMHRSAQLIVTEALDRYFAEISPSSDQDCRCFADGAKACVR